MAGKSFNISSRYPGGNLLAQPAALTFSASRIFFCLLIPLFCIQLRSSASITGYLNKITIFLTLKYSRNINSFMIEQFQYPACLLTGILNSHTAVGAD